MPKPDRGTIKKGGAPQPDISEEHRHKDAQENIENSIQEPTRQIIHLEKLAIVAGMQGWFHISRSMNNVW